MKPPLWVLALVRRAFPSRFFLSKLTRKSRLFSRLIDYTLFRDDHITYLPNPRTIDVHTQIESPGQLVLPTATIEHFIGQAKSHFIMDSCICRQSDSCDRHSIDLGCLFMGEAVHSINKKLGRVVSRDQAKTHVRRAEKEGLIFLIARNHIDTLWTGAKPGGKLLTVCFCCQCCCLWKTLPVISDQIGNKVHGLPGIRVEVTDTCVGCGECIDGPCFAGAISLVEGKAIISDGCRGCGRCVSVCPEKAIALTLPGNGAVQSLINHLDSLVDLD